MLAVHVVPAVPAEQPRVPPVPEVKGEWTAAGENCYVIRASREFKDACDADVLEVVRACSGRYFRICDELVHSQWRGYLFRQEVGAGQYNTHEYWMWKDTESSPGWFVGPHPTREPLVWVEASSDSADETSPAGRCFFPYSSAKKRIKWSKDRWVP